MGRHRTIIPLAPVHALLKVDAMQVSKEAAVVVAQHLEDLGKKVAVQAQYNALHRGKKTVEKDDIVLAFKQLRA